MGYAKRRSPGLLTGTSLVGAIHPIFACVRQCMDLKASKKKEDPANFLVANGLCQPTMGNRPSEEKQAVVIQEEEKKTHTLQLLTASAATQPCVNLSSPRHRFKKVAHLTLAVKPARVSKSSTVARAPGTVITMKARAKDFFDAGEGARKRSSRAKKSDEGSRELHFE